jgi:acylglycerol lipase
VEAPVEASLLPTTKEPAKANWNFGPRRIESRFRGHQNVSLFMRAWVPESPRRAIVVVHGVGEHSGRYEVFGDWFARSGAAVYSFDLRGHGRSGGPRGHADCFDDYLNDLEIFLQIVREAWADLPLCLVGHSMGGLVVAASAVDRNPDVTCIATSGAALMVSPAFSRTKVRLARFVRSFAPSLSFESGIDHKMLSSIDEVVEKYGRDELVHGRVSTSLAVALFDTIERVRLGGKKVARPMLLMHGALDRICPPEGSDAFYRSLAGAAKEAGAPRAELRIYSRSLHEIFLDVESEIVFSDLLHWIEQCEADLGVVDDS